MWVVLLIEVLMNMEVAVALNVVIKIVNLVRRQLRVRLIVMMAAEASQPAPPNQVKNAPPLNIATPIT